MNCRNYRWLNSLYGKILYSCWPSDSRPICSLVQMSSAKYSCDCSNTLLWCECNFFQTDFSILKFAHLRKFIKFQILNQCVCFWSRQQNIALSLRKLFFTRDQCAHNIRTPHKVSSKTVVWDHYKGCSITECWDSKYI